MTEEQHLLTILMEECAEVTQRASKAIRFGMHEVQPGQCKHNQERLEFELSDLFALCEMLDLHIDPDLMAAKKHKVQQFMCYSREQGQVE